MKRFVLFALLVPIRYAEAAGGIVHVADGDCPGLQAAVSSAQPNGPATTIVLARNSSYGYFPIVASGNVHLEGAGARLQIGLAPDVSSIHIAIGANVSIRALNLPSIPAPIPPAFGSADFCIGYCVHAELPAILNEGTLVLDSVSESGVDYSYGSLIENLGHLVLRNSTIIKNFSTEVFGSVFSDGAQGTLIEINQSTIAFNNVAAGSLGNGVFDAPWYEPGYSGTIRISNSTVASNSGLICNPIFLGTNEFMSAGGNVFSDDSCDPHSPTVADARFADFGKHGGVVDTLALDYNSPAIGAGLAANCEATDARGVARGQNKCDAGAYEFGGGLGKLTANGISGLYYDAAHDGHYVSVQRVSGDRAVVIWNTFDQKGTPAWLFGVGTQSGSMIHVGKVYETLGGNLHLGGSVTGATPSLWGSFDFNTAGCYAANLNYQSPQPLFGSGQVALQRLAFVNGLDCSQ